MSIPTRLHILAGTGIGLRGGASHDTFGLHAKHLGHDFTYSSTALFMPENKQTFLYCHNFQYISRDGIICNRRFPCTL